MEYRIFVAGVERRRSQLPELQRITGDQDQDLAGSRALQLGGILPHLVFAPGYPGGPTIKNLFEVERRFGILGSFLNDVWTFIAFLAGGPEFDVHRVSIRVAQFPER